MLVSFAVFALVCSVSAAPREKRFDIYDSTFPFSYAFSRPFGGGAFSGALFPWYQPIPMYIPMPDFSQMIPWYKGKNVCETKKMMEEPQEMKEMQEFMSDGLEVKFDYSHESESCKGNSDKYVCIRRVHTNEGNKMEMTKYECCYGFVRATDSSPGCVESGSQENSSATGSSPSQTKMKEQYKYNLYKGSFKGATIDLRYLMPTLRNMGATQMVKVAEKAGMMDDFHDNNYTVFCPPNHVLEAMQDEVEDEMENGIPFKIIHQKIKKKTRLYKIVTSHLSPGFFKTDDFADGQLLQTDNPDSEIRINVYFIPHRVITANCVPILSEDHFARNGIVHVVEKMLPTPSKTVADIIAGDPQFSILKRMLSTAGLVQTLRSTNASYTLFAPTDSAFRSTTRHSIEHNRCTINLMKHHIVSHVICSAALPQYARSLNMIGELLSLSRDQHNKLYVDDVQVVVRDLVATNGVVHIIDGVLTARQTKPVSEILEESGLYEFLSLFEDANLTLEVDSFENVTFFIPTNEVMQNFLPNHLEALLKYNNHTLQDLLRYHIVDGQTELRSADKLLSSKLQNSSVRFQVYTKHPERTPQLLAQCAKVLNADIRFCGGTLHVIDKLLLPPKFNIMEFLENIEVFSTLVLLLRATGLDRRLRNEEFSFTLFAPTEDAFHQMGEEDMFRILENPQRATDLMKMHIIPGSVCCCQLNNELLLGRQSTRTMEGSLLNLDRSMDGILMANGAHVVDCDIMARNGVIHMVDAVLSQQSYSHGNFLNNLLIFV